MRATIITSLCALSLVACGAANSLEGSISESFSLEYDRVEIFKQGNALKIEYRKDVAGSIVWVCQVIVEKTDELNLKKDTDIKGDTFLMYVSILRVSNTGGPFPDTKNGKVHFDEYKFEAGGRIDGNFETVFANGRTLSGNFDAIVKEIDTGP